jgi:glycosyltransferase involved in cell wall biosynthesis
MLTGNVIVTPNYPPTAELLSDENCWFALPENEKSLAETIKKAIDNKEISSTKAKIARDQVLKNTFTLKVKRIIEFIEK